MKWQIVDTEVASAEENMRIDEELLQGLSKGSPCILRFYRWSSPSATYGYFLNPLKHVKGEMIEDKNSFKSITQDFHLARRPTGGGMLFHLWDMTFSILIPADHPSYSVNTLENYAFVNQMVLKSIESFSSGLKPYLLKEDCLNQKECFPDFCMAKPILNDVMIEGLKVSGGAQRRTRNGFLHQGTISILKPDADFLFLLLPGVIMESILNNSFFLINHSEGYDQTLLKIKKEMMNQVI